MQDIIQHMRLNGINPPEPLIPDEKIHRFPIDQNDKKKSGWYRGFRNVTRVGTEFFVFVYGNHRNQETLKAITGIKLDKQDRSRLDEQVRKTQRAIHLEKLELQKKAAENAKEIWGQLNETFGKNEYLEKKGFKSLFGARIHGFILAIPMRDIDGDLKNIERVYGDGAMKKGLFGGQRTGLFHQIGELGDVIYIAEGFSTGVTVHLAMQTGVVVTFNAGNLEAVACALAKKYPAKKIVIAGDNDQHPSHKTGEIHNVGAIKAEEAANAAGGKFVLPTFKSLDGQPTDFNDLAAREGIDTVKKQILGIEPGEEVEMLDRAYIIRAPYPDDEEFSKAARRGTMTNVCELLRRLRVRVRYNVISKEEEILIPGGVFTLDNKANSTLAYLVDWCERVKIPTTNLGAYLTAIADANLYNPVVDWIESKPWDKKSRLEELYATIAAKNESTNFEILAMKEKLIRAWMISAVAAAYESHGVSAQGVLVFQGAQNLGKTKWFKSLVPQDLNLTADGITLNPDNDDSVLQVISKWLVELGEMDGTLNRSDTARLKAFITKSRDEMRRKYAKKSSRYVRRTVFFGSVNEANFLRDSTGNRRFWTIECEKINHNHGLDMQQVWAEIKERYENGESWRLTDGEVESLNAHNENFQTIDSIEERIKTQFDWCADSPEIKWMTATQVCIEIGIKDPKNSDARAAGTALRKLTKSETKKINGTPRFPVPHRS